MASKVRNQHRKFWGVIRFVFSCIFIIEVSGQCGHYTQSKEVECYALFFCLFVCFFICSEFCHTLEWNSHGFTCVPHPDPPSHLPLHPLPLGFPSAPGPSARNVSVTEWKRQRCFINITSRTWREPTGRGISQIKCSSSCCPMLWSVKEKPKGYKLTEEVSGPRRDSCL